MSFRAIKPAVLALAICAATFTLSGQAALPPAVGDTPMPSLAPMVKRVTPAVVNPGPVAEPAPTIIIRTEVYGQMIMKVGKVATFLSLVSTSTDPVPEGAKGLLFRRIEEPGKMPYYVEIAEVSIKKLDKGGKIQLTVENEKKDVLVNGKKANHFLKNTKIKLQIDRPG